MDEQGLITRRRDPANRRVHLVELTDAGEAAFERLRGAAGAFDKKLRAGFSDDEVADLEALLRPAGGQRDVTAARAAGQRAGSAGTLTIADPRSRATVARSSATSRVSSAMRRRPSAASRDSAISPMRRTSR